jgi:hypothetical protein
VAKVAGYVKLPIDEEALRNAVETIGPIAVGKTNSGIKLIFIF